MRLTGGVISSNRRRAGAAPFNPLTAHTWHSAYWADDANWARPADGLPVSSWRDGSGNLRDLAQGTIASQPTMRNAVAALLNKAALSFDNVDDYMDGPAFTALASGEVLVVLNVKGTATTSPFFDAADTTARRWFVRWDTTPAWGMHNGSLQVGPAETSLVGGHFVRAQFKATDELHVDGVSKINANAGSHSFTQLRIGANNGLNPANCDIAFIGVSDTALTASKAQEFLDWSRSYYGTP